MAQGFVQLATDGSGKKIDTQVTTTAAQHRQVMVIGAKDTDANVAPVDATKGLAVDLTNTGANTNKLLVIPDLPSGASTAAKQPALGTAGSASSDVITVQGIASMTAVKVDGSGVTQPVSGTVTANSGTNLNTSALALETGGNLAAAKTDLDTISGAVLAQGSTTSGQNGHLAQTATTTSAPTYTTAKTNPLSTDTSGNLRVLTTGSVTANAGTNLNTSLLALESGGNLATIVTNTGNAATSANQTNGTQQTKLTNGANIADVVAGDSGFNGVASAIASKTVSFTTSASGVQVIGPYNCEGFASVEIVYTSVGSGLALNGQWSPTSGGTYVSTQSFGNQGNSPINNLGTTSGTIYFSVVQGNYFQINVTALTSGTFAGTITFRAAAKPYPLAGATQNGTWTVGSNSATGSAIPANAFFVGVTDGTNLRGINAISNTADGQTSTGSASVGLMVWNGTNYDRLRQASTANNTTGTGLLGVGLLEWDGTNYQRVPSARFAPSATKLNTNSYHITTNVTTTPTASTAYISSIAISAEVGGTTSSITIQDKQATPLKLVNGLATTAVSSTPTVISFQTPVLMTSGIDIITAGAVAGTVDVWINWYQ